MQHGWSMAHKGPLPAKDGRPEATEWVPLTYVFKGRRHTVGERPRGRPEKKPEPSE